MDVRRMQMFLSVADSGGFTRAARAMYVSQPSLSQAVRELEEELGVTLFHRLGRQVRLTPAGHALTGPARLALKDVEAAKSAVAAVRGLEAGRLELCSLPTLAADPLADLIGRFRRAHPGVEVFVEDADDPGTVAQLIRAGTSEVGVSEESSALGVLVTHRLTTQDLVAVLPPGFRALRSRLPLGRLNDVAVIAAPAGTSSRRLLDEAFAKVGLEASIAVVAAQRDAIVSLVLAGAGAALMPRPIAETASRLGATVMEVTPRVRRTVVLVHRHGPLSPSADTFLGLALGRTGRIAS